MLRYVGQWLFDKQTGTGTFYYNDGGVYEGPWVKNVRVGQGKHTFPDGSTFEGDFVDHKFHGFGVFVYSGKGYEPKTHFPSSDINSNGANSSLFGDRYPTGTKYTGPWVRSHAQGEGVLEFPDGSVYRGTFVNGNRHGKGVMTWPIGDRYEGMVRESLRACKCCCCVEPWLLVVCTE